MIKSEKKTELHDIFFSYLVCLHELFFITQNETYLISDLENSVYINHKCCNTIHIFIYMCISCNVFKTYLTPSLCMCICAKGLFYSD